MPDATPPVDLTSLAAGGNHPWALWRLDGDDLQANLVRLDQGDRIQPHRNPLVSAGRYDLATKQADAHPTPLKGDGISMPSPHRHGGVARCGFVRDRGRRHV